MVLVGGDGGELGFGEDERLEVLRERHVLGLGVDVDGVETGLVLVHRVQYYLRANNERRLQVSATSSHHSTRSSAVPQTDALCPSKSSVKVACLVRCPGRRLSTKGGNVTSAGWQVTLCDPMWHVSSRSGVATLRTAIHLLLTYLLGRRLPSRVRQHSALSAVS